MTPYVETHLFKDFAERAKRHLHGRTKSSVSQLWSSCFKLLFKQFGEIAEQVNLNLRSHHGKSGSNQKLEGNPLTAGLPATGVSQWLGCSIGSYSVRICCGIRDYVKTCW